MSEEHEDALRLYDRLNQTRANNGGTLSKEEWLRIGAEQFRAVRDEERRTAGRNPKRSKGVRDPLFDTLATACGMNLKEITRSAAKAVGVALAGIRTATPDVTPEEITLRVNTYKRIRSGWALTPGSIEKYWPTLGTGRATAKAAENDPRIKQGAPVGWREHLQKIAAEYTAKNNGATGDLTAYLAMYTNFKDFPTRWQEVCWRDLQS